MEPTPLDRLQLALSRRRPRSRAGRAGWWVARYVAALTRDCVDGDVNLRAMSFVYTTLLSLVPLLALGFALLKALGVHHGLNEILENLLQPLGADGALIARQLVDFVDHVKVGVLGAVGVAFLVYTAISMIYKVESSFNALWEVGSRIGHVQRIGEYIAVLVVGPLVVFSVLGVTASLKNQHLVAEILAIGPFGDLLVWASKLATYLLMVGVFAFIYSFMPNLRVKFRAALVGGVCTGIAWQTASLGFATFVSRASNYNAIYSGFAILIFLLLWIYIGWLIVLLGCRLSFYVQFPERLTPRRATDHGPRARETLALTAVALVALHYIAGLPTWTPARLARHLGVAADELEATLRPLIKARLLAQSVSVGELLPARDVDGLTVGEVWRCVRGGGPRWPGEEGTLAYRYVADVEAHATGDLTLRQWLQQLPPMPSVSGAVALHPAVDRVTRRG
ncbi:MAG TPA: YihY/virulence factor BrkB family protein [Nevskiaceae bacterium]|nr:YihY/virulence factor BrkB family protein [Nevskiaceae bacterium]